jgi:Obg family GTPase CgtA-like protein
VVPRRPVIRPIRSTRSFSVESDGRGGFVVRGARPERWIAQTNFDNDEAVGYLGDRLARLGVEDQLLKLGAKPGCAVTIGDMTFDWEPQTRPGGRHDDRARHRHPPGAQRPGGRRRTQGARNSAAKAIRERIRWAVASVHRDAIRTARRSSSRSAPPR